MLIFKSSHTQCASINSDAREQGSCHNNKQSSEKNDCMTTTFRQLNSAARDFRVVLLLDSFS